MSGNGTLSPPLAQGVASVADPATGAVFVAPVTTVSLAPAPASPDVPPLSQAERVDIRRFLGRSTRGVGATLDPFGRWFVEDPTLEWRLSWLTVDELPVLRQKLADLKTLDQAIVAASSGLDTKQAAVFTRNPDEMAERARLYTDRRVDLADFLGVDLGRGLVRGGGVRLVV